LFKLGFEQAVNPFLMFVSLGMTLLLFLDQALWPYEDTIMTVMGICYYGYLAYRILTKLIVQRSLPPGSAFFPGALPLTYSVYRKFETPDATEYVYSKRNSLTRKTAEVYHVTLPRGAPEEEWAQIAIGALPPTQFYSHWMHAIPFVSVDGQNARVRLIFTEASFAFGGFCVTVVIDQETKEIVDLKQGFERFRKKPREESK
jgi:hypothetical protein